MISLTVTSADSRDAGGDPTTIVRRVRSARVHRASASVASFLAWRRSTSITSSIRSAHRRQRRRLRHPERELRASSTILLILVAHDFVSCARVRRRADRRPGDPRRPAAAAAAASGRPTTLRTVLAIGIEKRRGSSAAALTRSIASTSAPPPRRPEHVPGRNAAGREPPPGIRPRTRRARGSLRRGAAPPPGVRNTPGVATDGNGAAVSAEASGGGRETARGGRFRSLKLLETLHQRATLALNRGVRATRLDAR